MTCLGLRNKLGESQRKQAGLHEWFLSDFDALRNLILSFGPVAPIMTKAVARGRVGGEFDPPSEILAHHEIAEVINVSSGNGVNRGVLCWELSVFKK